MRRYLSPAIWGVVAVFICAAAPVVFINECWRIAEKVGGADIAVIFKQLQHAALGMPWPVIALCGAAVAAVKLAAGKHRVTAGIFCIVLIIAGMALSLLQLKVNGIPVITVVRIALNYMRLGAF